MSEAIGTAFLTEIFQLGYVAQSYGFNLLHLFLLFIFVLIITRDFEKWSFLALPFSTFIWWGLGIAPGALLFALEGIAFVGWMFSSDVVGNVLFSRGVIGTTREETMKARAKEQEVKVKQSEQKSTDSMNRLLSAAKPARGFSDSLAIKNDIRKAPIEKLSLRSDGSIVPFLNDKKTYSLRRDKSKVRLKLK